MKYKRTIVALAVLVTPLVVPLSVYAHDGEHTDGTSHSTTDAEKQRLRTAELEKRAAELRKKAEEKATQLRQSAQDKKTLVRQKLDDAKKRICANREKTIIKRLTNVVDVRQKQIEHIDKIVKRTKDFYVKKGKTLANYDDLVAAVDEKRAAAVASLDTTKTGTTFSCDSDGPKQDLQDFKAKRTVLVDAIKEYRTAAKNLIVGVKSVQGTTSRGDQQ